MVFTIAQHLTDQGEHRDSDKGEHKETQTRVSTDLDKGEHKDWKRLRQGWVRDVVKDNWQFVVYSGLHQ